MREMKDSGVRWIGKVPSNWIRKKVKNVVSLIGSGTTPTSTCLQYYESEDVNWIQSGDIYGVDTVVKTTTMVSNAAVFSLSALHVYKPDFIVVAMYGGSVGNIAVSKIEACVNQACCCIQTDNQNDLKFMYYWIYMCKSDFLRVSEGGGQPNISQAKIRNQYYIQPPIAEQQRIADFLDAKCAEIDALTADIQTQIDTLEQYKKSKIFKAVSQGIGDTNMKSTNSDVWTNIPQNWSLVDIKYLFEIVKRIAGKEGYDILSVTQKGLKIKDISNNEGQIANDYSGYQFVYPTDYVMNHMDLLTGWVDCSSQFGVTSPDYRVFRLKDKRKNSLEYYKYVMQCCYMCRIFYSLGQGVSTLGRWRLQTSSFMNFQVPVPPLKDQINIAAYLDYICGEIDGLIESKSNQLDILADYKKSLIFEYVTGKKEVPLS